MGRIVRISFMAVTIFKANYWQRNLIVFQRVYVLMVSQHGAVKQQTITWTNVGLDLMSYCDTRPQWVKIKDELLMSCE